MSLTNKLVLVAGATGEIGRGAALALAQAGAYVTLVGRNADKLKKIQHTLPAGRSSVIVADYSSLEGAKKLEEETSNMTFDVVVASSGPWWTVQSMAKADLGTLHEAVASNFQAQVNLYNVLAKVCTGSYLMVNGTAARMLPGSGVTGIMANACVGASQVMYKECSADDSLPEYTHVLVASSVGHAQFRQNTADPNEFGQVFVAMALGKHKKDDKGTVVVDDAMYQALVDML